MNAQLLLYKKRMIVIKYFTLVFILTIGGWTVFNKISDLEIVMVINQAFLIGLISLIIGLSIFVYKTGFFDLFLKGFIQLKQIFFRKPRSLIDLDKINNKNIIVKKQTLIFFIIQFSAVGSGSILYSISLLVIL